MSNTLFIDTQTLPRTKGPQGEFVEILNGVLAGAENVLGTLRWLQSGEKFNTDALDQHQLIYLMEGDGVVDLQGREHEVTKGMGVYLGPSETATVRAAPGASVKLLHLVVRRTPG